MIEQLPAQQRVTFESQSTRINITVKNPKTSNIVVQTTPVFLGLRPAKPIQQKLALDKNGSGSTSVFLKGPSFIKIMNVWNDSSIDYLIIPGKDFSVVLDAQDRSFVTYNERWEKEMNFYDFMMKDAQRRLDEIPWNDPKRFLQDWIKQNDYNHSLIQMANKTGIDPHYTDWVSQSVYSLFYATLISQLVDYITIVGEWPVNMEQYIVFFKPLRGTQFSDSSYFNSESDKDWVTRYFLFDAANFFYKNDSIHVPGLEEIYKYAITKAKKIKDHGVKKIINQYLIESAAGRTNDINFLAWLKRFITDQMESGYNTSVVDNRSQLLHLAPTGEPALFFEAEDKDGSAFSFDNFKGKYIYLDVWATWCIPCRRQIPYLDKLKEKFKGRPIEFVSISEDKSIDEWRNYLKNIPNTTGQFISNPGLKESISRTYQVRYIPTFILIDPNGRLVSTNCFRPSDPALDMLLEKLVN